MEPNSQSQLSDPKHRNVRRELLVVKVREGFDWWLVLKEGSDWPV